MEKYSIKLASIESEIKKLGNNSKEEKKIIKKIELQH